MKINSLSVPRNGNQSSARQARHQPSSGGEAVAGQREVTTTLGAGAKSATRGDAGGSSGAHCRVSRGGQSSDPASSAFPTPPAAAATKPETPRSPDTS